MSKLGMQLEDDSAMPFGKHAGLAMKEVPVDYLHWLWHNGLKDGGKDDRAFLVSDYIRRSLPALKKENPDLIWS